MPDDYPDDENGWVLSAMRSDGADLTTPRDIDFSVIFRLKGDAQRFCAHFSNLGFEARIEKPGGPRPRTRRPWDTTVVKHMVPTHAAITSFEEELGKVATPLEGKNDGWGFFRL